jgi:hypothetical protein
MFLTILPVFSDLRASVESSVHEQIVEKLSENLMPPVEHVIQIYV